MTRLLVLVLVLGCGKSSEDKVREQAAKDMARAGSNTEPAQKREAPPPKKKEEAPPDPEPTTAEEIDTARKKAMIAGKDKDVIKYCEMGKVDPESSDGQILLGCALAACRINEADKARTWAKGMLRNKKDKPLYDQAVKTCLSAKTPVAL